MEEKREHSKPLRKKDKNGQRKNWRSKEEEEEEEEAGGGAKRRRLFAAL